MKYHHSLIMRMPENLAPQVPEIVPISEPSLDLVWEKNVGQSRKGWFGGLATSLFQLSVWGVGLWGVGALISYALHGRW